MDNQFHEKENKMKLRINSQKEYQKKLGEKVALINEFQNKYNANLFAINSDFFSLQFDLFEMLPKDESS